MSTTPFCPSLLGGPDVASIPDYRKLIEQLDSPHRHVRWDTQIESANPAQGVKADFKQSTFYGMPLSIDALKKRNAHHVPQLKPDGQVDYAILKLMTGEIALKQIAEQVYAQFPDHFESLAAALKRVSELSEQYSL